MVSSEIVFGGAILGVALIYGIYEYATKETNEELRYPSFSRYMTPAPRYDNNNNVINDRYSSFSNVQQGGSRRNRRKNRKTKRT
jgi:hypothetical protein